MQKVAGFAGTERRVRRLAASVPIAGRPARPSAGVWFGLALWLGFSATGLFLLNPTQLWMAICTSN